MAQQLAKNVSFRNNTSWTSLLDMVYPKGSYYFSNSSTNPANLFGGGWTAITGRFLYMNAGTGTGGENTHKLTISEMPSHNHGIIDGLGAGWNPSGAAGDKLQYSSVAKGRDMSEFFGTRYEGGGTAHNNMPAYKTVYAWYRTS